MELAGQLGIFAVAVLGLAWTFKVFVPRLMEDQRKELAEERAERSEETKALIRNTIAVRSMADAVRDLAVAIRGCPGRKKTNNGPDVDALVERIQALRPDESFEGVEG